MIISLLISLAASIIVAIIKRILGLSDKVQASEFKSRLDEIQADIKANGMNVERFHKLAELLRDVKKCHD
jgi:hypothetical protein